MTVHRIDQHNGRAAHHARVAALNRIEQLSEGEFTYVEFRPEAPAPYLLQFGGRLIALNRQQVLAFTLGAEMALALHRPTQPDPADTTPLTPETTRAA